MREHFLVVLLYFLYISFRIPVSYPKERVGLLGANFLPQRAVITVKISLYWGLQLTNMYKVELKIYGSAIYST